MTIIDRLRSVNRADEAFELCAEAANEIERLQLERYGAFEAKDKKSDDPQLKFTDTDYPPATADDDK